METKERIWPRRAEEEGSEAKAREAMEREERRRKAKERQQKLIEEFASMQKQFMEKAMETGTVDFLGGETKCVQTSLLILFFYFFQKRKATMPNGMMEVLLKLNQNMIVLFAIKLLRPLQTNLWGNFIFFKYTFDTRKNFVQVAKFA